MGSQDSQVAPSTKETAILESVASNIEAGIHIIDEQEVGLAKIGGKLADISLALNRCKSPKARSPKTIKVLRWMWKRPKEAINKLLNPPTPTPLFSLRAFQANHRGDPQSWRMGRNIHRPAQLGDTRVEDCIKR